jgi:ElaB/YqjD/DUF883 family membrane-anchored ribosome-binding protein
MIRIPTLELQRRDGIPVGSNRWEKVRQGLQQGVQAAEDLVARRPGLCLAVALCAGMLAGWRIKRK